MNSRGERIFSPECGWCSLSSLIQAPINSGTVRASGSGVTWRDAVALRDSHRGEAGLQAELAGEDLRIPCDVRRAVVGQHVDDRRRTVCAEPSLDGLEHQVPDGGCVRPDGGCVRREINTASSHPQRSSGAAAVLRQICGILVERPIPKVPHFQQAFRAWLPLAGVAAGRWPGGKART